MSADLRELGQLGARTPTGLQVSQGVRTQTDVALAGMYAAPGSVPSSQRGTFAGLCAGWAQMAERWVNQVLAAPSEAA